MLNVQNQAFGKDWALYQNDCIPVVEAMPESSIDFSVYSPPFRNLYIYSESEADMGNSDSMEEFLVHYEYLLDRLYRATVPGRLTAVHVKDLPLYKNSSEWFGIEDFSGLTSYLHRKVGWIFHSRITIWKDPVIEMEKTNSHGLLHKNFAQRTQVCRTGLPDYVMVFVKPDPDGMGKDINQLRKPGDYIGTNPPKPHEYLSSIRTRKPDWFPGTIEEYNYSIAVWQRYASPVWMDIDQTDVLNYRVARDSKDEKHIAPLQLGVIRRCVDMWTRPGETVFTPFAGIGSEVVVSVEMGRKGIGTELKDSYFNQAVKFCKEAELKRAQPTLFDLLDAHEAADD
jgi:hypothetical protein